MMRPLLGILLLLVSLSLSAQVPTGGLVAYYPFNNNAADASGKGNDGEMVGGVKTCPDRFGNGCSAMQFNGTDAFISVPNSQSLQSLAGSMSATVWFKVDKGDSKLNEARLVLFSKGGASAATGEKPGYHIQYVQSFSEAKGQFRLSNDLTGDDKDYGSHRIEFGTWYFFAVVYDENWVQVYLNGKVIWQGVYNKAIAANDFALDIGKDAFGGIRFFNGCMDDLRIYSRGLSAADVNAIYKDESSKNSGATINIKLPSDIEQSTDPGKCAAIVKFTEPTATVSCGKAVINQISGMQSGSMFNAGLSIITFEAASGGKTQSAMLNVKVVDNEAPVLQCPANVVVKAPAGTTGAKVEYPLITATDNCPNVKTNMVSGAASGSVFKLGSTTVKYTAVDAAGNTTECSFKVTVDEDIKPTVRCTQDITAYTKPGGGDVIVTYTEPYIEIKGQKIPMTLKMGGASGSTFGIGRTIVSYTTASSAYGDQLCNFTVTVKDTIRPVITCNKDIRVMCDEPGQTTKAVTYTEPTATDAGATVKTKLVEGLVSGADFPVGTTKVVYEASDISGNKSVCSFKVIVDARPEPAAKPTLHCTEDITIYTDANTKDALITYTEPYIELKGQKIAMVLKSGLHTGSRFAAGKNTVTYTATRADLAGLTCSFTITVKDTIAPTITCKDDIHATADPANDLALVTFTPPVATDGGLPLTAKHVAGLKSGERFPLGITVVTYEATDASGNKSSCSFNVIVAEKEIPPVPHCPKDMVAYTKPNSNSAVVTYTEPYLEYKGSKVNMLHKAGPLSGSVFEIGKSTVTYVAPAGYGDLKCVFTITVKDTISPVVKCAGDISMATAPGQTTAVVTYNEPTATDGGSEIGTTLIAGLKSGAVFPTGTTTVTYEAVDFSGNKKTCSFKVTVTATKAEPVAPAVLVPHCTKDITAYVPMGSSEATVNYEEPYVDLGGKKLSMALKSGGLPGSKFAIGKTVVTYALVNTDAGDVKCSFTVTVKDTIAPLIACNGDIKATCEYGANSVAVEYTIPMAADAGQTLTPKLVSGLKSGEHFPLGVTTVTYEATDASGNKRTCSFKVTVESKPAPAAAAPAKEVKEQAAEETFWKKTEETPAKKEPAKETAVKKAEPQEPEPKAAQPVIAKTAPDIQPAVKVEEPVTKSEPVKEPVTKTTEPVAKVEPAIVTEVKKEEPAKPAPATEVKKDVAPAKPASANAAKTSSKTLAIECPGDITRSSDAGRCGANVEYNAPKAHGQNIKVAQVHGLASGAFYPTGNTVNTFRVTDNTGAIKECSVNIRVTDNVKPTMNCPADTIIMLSHNRKGIIYNYDEPVATDDCRMDSIARTAGSKTGCFLPVGVHPFIFDAVDAGGNKTRCSFTVTVKADEREEVIALPKKLNKSLNMGTDSIHYEHQEQVQNCLLTVIIYDDGEEDGDSVSIIFDDVVIVNKEKIRIKENGYIKKQIVLIGGQDNYLISKAWNTGRTGLNTLKIDIYEGAMENEKRDMKTKVPVLTKVLHARPGVASGIVLKCNW